MHRVGPDPAADPGVREAAELLLAGEVVAFPTETVYGLGADATSVTAVEKIYAAKQRPRDNPAIVHLASAADLPRVARETPPEAETLAARFWPGPLTLILPATDAVRDAVGRGLDTVGVRVPGHPVARALLALAGLPVAAPSANLSGRPSPTTAAHVLDDLGDRIPLILDGGPCTIGLESTVLDLSEGDPIVLRPGGVSRREIEEVLGRPVREHATEEAKRRSPGTRYRHYSPEAPVVLVRAGCDTTVLAAWASSAAGLIGYIGWRGVLTALPNVVSRAVPEGDAAALASRLYGALRELDAAGARVILCDEPATGGLGTAVAERLARAATLVFEPGESAPRPRA